jgi:hypothetical protein
MIRDSNTNALINDDRIAFNKYKADRSQIRKIEQLTKELAEVKQTLKRVCAILDKIEKA